MPNKKLSDLFDSQLNILLEKELPELAGLTKEKFIAQVLPLKDKLATLKVTTDNTIPFILVVRNSLVPAEKIMPVNMHPVSPENFSPIAQLTIPESPLYLAVNISTGHDLLNVTPNDALEIINDQGRSPLTIDEGVALFLHNPDILQKQNAYSLLGSRSGDKRVPAIWISYGKPRLGWCWAGNPHIWLGSASCATRIGI